VVAKVEWHKGELFPRVGFIVTNLIRPAKRVVRFYNQRGTAEQWIKEGKNAVKWTRLSCHEFDDNKVRLHLFVLATTLGTSFDSWSCARDQALDPDNDSGEIDQDWGKDRSPCRRVVFQLAEVAVPRRLFLAILCAIDRLRLPMPAPG